MLRRSEIILTAYFCYAAIVAVVQRGKSEVTAVVVLLNATVIAGIHLLAYAHSLRARRGLETLRNWFPVVLILLAYRQMGWIGRPPAEHHLELAWVRWDKLLLNEWGLKACVEGLGPVVPAVLEVAYSLVSAIPVICIATLAITDHRDRMDRLLTMTLLGALVSYALFPYFPSEPPRTIFPGQDAPSYDTVFRQFNWWLLGGYGIHASVFPSAHVSLAFAAAAGIRRCLPEVPWVGRSLLVLAALIAVSTVYGRYHYAVDAVAGLAVAGIAVLADRRL